MNMIQDEESMMDNNSSTLDENGKPRFCRKCHIEKPDRAHHCSVCGV
jgi:ribosomal protein L40E